jgi:hypothetical protein
MAVAAAILDQYDGGQGRIIIIGTLTFSGVYAALGDPFDFGTITEGSGQPLIVRIATKNGFMYNYDYVNKKILVRGYTPTSATAGVIPFDEIAAGAYPAGVTGDPVRFECVSKLV